MFEKGVLRKIFGSQRDRVKGQWTIMYVELYDLHSSSHIIQAVKWTKWDGRGMWHVWGTGETHTGFRLGDLKERDHFEDPGVDRRIILKRIF